ncbi:MULTISPECIES: ABC transporter permease [unclassified Roseitalea]|uniref:ABC transporter permease n=1 Tax=unclassified Roseitalea TaxID=2639107 RepID=UPI00273F34D6|nr:MULTISPECIES: ABC transporter permease [unclassified Roseitalea]
MANSFAAPPKPVAATRRGRLGPADVLRLVPWVIATGFVLAALLAPLIAPYDPIENVGMPMMPLFTDGHVLGTDGFGRDQLSRLLYGLRPMLVVSLGSVVLALVVGGIYGLVSGVSGWRIDWVMMRAVDIVMSFPLILAAILVLAALGASLVNLTLAVAVSQLPIFARLARALASGEAARDYAMAARAAGFAPIRIMVREVAPNIIRPLLVQATSVVAVAALTAAALSYLGLGVRPPAPDLGYMVKEGQELIFIAPEQALLPGLVIAIFALAVSFCGDQLGDDRAVGMAP